jgi:MoaA/NifB/PqqE/SkfB family radical SAM enzyme
MSNEKNFNEVKKMKDRLSNVSKTMCTAKWLQSTILLYNGETHSCHHPARHKIPLDGLKENPTSIHNTPIKIYARNELLNGIQTAECEYCWRIENSNPDNLSDRVLKSASPWAKGHLEKVLVSGLGKSIEPTYLEVAFDYTCNFACVYCTPDVSSAWMKESRDFGPYQFSTGKTMHDVKWLADTGKLPFDRDEYNPYTEAFWKWWPELYPKLEVFRITGGEPLLSKHTWKIFEYIKENPNPHIELAVNTNLGVPDKLIARLIDEIRNVQSKVKEVKIFTSFESTGRAAEYARYGMEYDKFISNIDMLMTELPDVRIVIMTTCNILSLTTFDSFLKEVIALRAKHYQDVAVSTLGLSINYLRWPEFLDIRIAPSEVKELFVSKVEEIIRFHRTKQPGFGESLLYLEEIDMLERLISYTMQSSPDEATQQQEFKDFVLEYDRRRNLNFIETFPALAQMVS